METARLILACAGLTLFLIGLFGVIRWQANSMASRFSWGASAAFAAEAALAAADHAWVPFAIAVFATISMGVNAAVNGNLARKNAAR